MKKHASKIAALVLGLALLGQQKQAHAFACQVSFDNNFYWTWSKIVNGASDTFADKSMMSGGKPVTCPYNGNTDDGTCYDFRQMCWSGRYISVFPQQYDHYHAVFDDPSITCIDFSVGIFGRMTLDRNGHGKCVACDYLNEPRHIATHDTDGWIEVAQKDTAGSGKYWTIPNVQAVVTGDQPVQIWFQKLDGSVWGVGQPTREQDERPRHGTYHGHVDRGGERCHSGH